MVHAYAFYMAWAKANVWQVILWWWGGLTATAAATSLVVWARIKS